MEKKVGEKFEFRGVMLEVVEGSSCRGCFAEHDDCSDMPFCASAFRQDGISVIFKKSVPSQTFADAFDELIEQAENLSRKAETPEQHSVCNEAVDRLIAMRARLSPVTAMTRAESYGAYIAKDSAKLVEEE